MTYYINRITNAVTVNRTKPQINVQGGVVYQINRSASGPRGQAAGQDVGWMVSVALGAGEVLNGPPLPHVQTWVSIYAHSDSGFAAGQVLTLRLKRANVVVATASLAVGPGAHDWETAITPINTAVADVPCLVLPNPADSQCTDLSVSLGSAP